MSLFAKLKNWSIKKKLIIGLSIFAALAIGVTTGLIIWQNNQKEIEDTGHYGSNKTVDKASKKNSKDYPDESHLLVSGMDEVYHSNSLEFDEDKISGLKDKSIEDKINREIAEIKQELENLPIAAGAIESGRVWCYQNANFGNILSMYCNRTDFGSDNKVQGTETRYLNYRLATGEPLKFTDIFVAGANYNQIIAEAYLYTAANFGSSGYTSDNVRCATTNSCDEIGGIFEPAYQHQPDYEEQIVKLVRNLGNPDDIQFTLSPAGVDFRVAGQKLHFEFAWDYSQVAIYKRFAKDDGIYDSDKKTYGLVFQEWIMAYHFGPETNNLFVDCTIYGYPFDNPNMPASRVKQLLEISNNKISELSNINDNRARVLVCSGYGDFDVYEMSKAYYDSTAYQQLIESCRLPASYSQCGRTWGDDANIKHTITQL
ncbi:hypothetical protein FWH58_01100 [Candidatus Saccharibacteria bacterium]|nr:hypothetical protein [Candidatus Saccharibacteria bacterium]